MEHSSRRHLRRPAVMIRGLERIAAEDFENTVDGKASVSGGE